MTQAHQAMGNINKLSTSRVAAMERKSIGYGSQRSRQSGQKSDTSYDGPIITEGNLQAFEE